MARHSVSSNAVVSFASHRSVTNILDLPIELIELILSYATFDEISRFRLISRSFDQCCQRLLNRGFMKVEKYHAQCFKKVKIQLPRRESERRSHPLARHCDVLSAIETRLSLLGMTYMKYVDMSLCCFIPGKVIDEIYRVLRFIQNNPNPPRVHELLQELRDISSMAMEYFEEKIAPSLKNRLSSPANVIVQISSQMNSCRSITSTPALPSNSSYSTTPVYTRSAYNDQEIHKLHMTIKQVQQSQVNIKREFNDIKIKSGDNALRRELLMYKKKFKEYEKINNDNQQTLAELKAQIEDMKRRMSENDVKIKTDSHLSAKNLGKKRIVSPKSKIIEMVPENDAEDDDDYDVEEEMTDVTDEPIKKRIRGNVKGKSKRVKLGNDKDNAKGTKMVTRSVRKRMQIPNHNKEKVSNIMKLKNKK